jgi:hypothetical protein
MVDVTDMLKIGGGRSGTGSIDETEQKVLSMAKDFSPELRRDVDNSIREFKGFVKDQPEGSVRQISQTDDLISFSVASDGSLEISGKSAPNKDVVSPKSMNVVNWTAVPDNFKRQGAGNPNAAPVNRNPGVGARQVLETGLSHVENLRKAGRYKEAAIESKKLGFTLAAQRSRITDLYISQAQEDSGLAMAQATEDHFKAKDDEYRLANGLSPMVGSSKEWKSAAARVDAIKQKARVLGPQIMSADPDLLDLFTRVETTVALGGQESAEDVINAERQDLDIKKGLNNLNTMQNLQKDPLVWSRVSNYAEVIKGAVPVRDRPEELLNSITQHELNYLQLERNQPDLAMTHLYTPGSEFYEVATNSKVAQETKASHSKTEAEARVRTLQSLGKHLDDKRTVAILQGIIPGAGGVKRMAGTTEEIIAKVNEQVPEMAMITKSALFAPYVELAQHTATLTGAKEKAVGELALLTARGKLLQDSISILMNDNLLKGGDIGILRDVPPKEGPLSQLYERERANGKAPNPVVIATRYLTDLYREGAPTKSVLTLDPSASEFDQRVVKGMRKDFERERLNEINEWLESFVEVNNSGSTFIHLDANYIKTEIYAIQLAAQTARDAALRQQFQYQQIDTQAMP